MYKQTTGILLVAVMKAVPDTPRCSILAKDHEHRQPIKSFTVTVDKPVMVSRRILCCFNTLSPGGQVASTYIYLVKQLNKNIFIFQYFKITDYTIYKYSLDTEDIFYLFLLLSFIHHKNIILYYVNKKTSHNIDI